jgi:hypothetical protein
MEEKPWGIQRSIGYVTGYTGADGLYHTMQGVTGQRILPEPFRYATYEEAAKEARRLRAETQHPDECFSPIRADRAARTVGTGG